MSNLDENWKQSVEYMILLSSMPSYIIPKSASLTKLAYYDI